MGFGVCVSRAKGWVLCVVSPFPLSSHSYTKKVVERKTKKATSLIPSQGSYLWVIGRVIGEATSSFLQLTF